MRVYNIPIEKNVVMNTTINSPACQLYQMYGYSIQAVWTGTPTGTFKLQASCDPCNPYEPNQYVPINWTDIANSSAAVSAAGNFTWNIFWASYNWVRMVYTDGSGGTSTAVLTSVLFNAKGQ